MSKTYEIAQDLHGKKLYQERARRILPILVRQAASKRPLSYEALADELSMTNPRVLNYPLGCVGRALIELAESWGGTIPHIQSLVVNKQTGLPGSGFDGFLNDEGYTWSDSSERRSAIEQYRTKIYEYPYWNDVLSELNLIPAPNYVADLIELASGCKGQGEGPEHKLLKEFISENPAIVGLAVNHPKGQIERGIPSGDRIDVIFHNRQRICAVEVKPKNAPAQDLIRGLFQCVKYRAVLEAHASFAGLGEGVAVCLVLGGGLPKNLVPLRNSLDVKVIENIFDLIPRKTRHLYLRKSL
ncbi:hypothetical protein [Methylobacterium sp. 17Sr1-1]|uniref:hypothetical protein n=1 Tax=Methylobacterium sp. 17Sr1-1 TaxID=2202826 RepID=UPI0013A545F8|nr:hypothetical protein [Methylobacterium sp. 17Sr1-1]